MPSIPAAPQNDMVAHHQHSMSAAPQTWCGSVVVRLSLLPRESVCGLKVEAAAGASEME